MSRLRKIFTKIPKILIAAPIIFILILTSLILTNIGKNETYFDQFFLGAKNLLKPQTPKIDPLESLVKSAAGFSGEYAIFIKDLRTQKTYSLNADKKFPSASLYKLAVMYEAYDAIDKGDLQKDEVLSLGKIALDKIIEGVQNKDSQQLENDQELVTFTVENALRAMITISDNYSAILLAKRLGWKNIDNFLEGKGLGDLDLAGPNAPQTNAQAIAMLLEQIYSNTAVNTKASREMKELLFNQQINDRIPKYLPDNVKVGHKTGELKSVRHDAGIIESNKGHYIFVFLSQTPNPLEASENIATLSKKIFDLLEKTQSK